MTYFSAQEMPRMQKDALLEWVQNEGLNPSEIVDNGLFSVHKGVVSGFKYLFNDSGEVLTKVHFTQAQKNSLPQVLS